MRKLWQLGLTAGVAAILAAPVAGQGTGGMTGGTGGGGGGGAGGSTLGNSNQSNIGGTQLSTQQKAPSLTAPGATNTNTNRAIDASNFLQQYYANPYYSGILTNAKNTSFVPGGFGQTTFTTTGGAGGTTGRGGQIGFAGGLGGTGTTAGVVSPSASGGGFAARGGGGGAGGVSVNLTDPGGQIVGLPRQIAYPAVVRFTTPAPTVTAMQTNLRGMLDRSTAIANPAGVQLTTGADGVVVVRGAVRDEDEARTVEGMIRLTPGVRAVRNELTFPRP